MLAPKSNLELKARDLNPRHTQTAARALGATDRGLVSQRDTFFWVPEGRLKLREESGTAELIHYQRADQPQATASRYWRRPIQDPEEMKEVLDRHLGVTAVVSKRRRLLVKDNVRIHLDEVEGLGAFVELEATPPPGHRPESQIDQINALRRALGISDELLVAGAYADQLTHPARPRADR